jgi:hypothetical protein
MGVRPSQGRMTGDMKVGSLQGCLLVWLRCKVAECRIITAMAQTGRIEVLFKGRQFDQEIIVLCVRWYLRYRLSTRDLVEMMAETRSDPGAHNDSALGAALRAGNLRNAGTVMRGRWAVRGGVMRLT